MADETHEIEDQIIDFVGFDLYEPTLRDVGMGFAGHDITDIDSVARIVEAVADEYNARVRSMEEEERRANAGRAAPEENPVIGMYKSRRGPPRRHTQGDTQGFRTTWSTR